MSQNQGTRIEGLCLANAFILADTHFNQGTLHQVRQGWKVGGYACVSLSEMNEMLIHNWNSVVGNDDWIIFVGDFMGQPTYKEVRKVLGALRGKKILVCGNHDCAPVVDARAWKYIFPHLLGLQLGDEPDAPPMRRKQFFFSHFPLRVWPNSSNGSFHIYAHTHVFDMRDRREFNAGADLPFSPYTPKRLDAALGAMAGRWFPARGGEPLPDLHPDIEKSFLEDYGKEVSIAKLAQTDPALHIVSGKFSPETAHFTSHMRKK